jgi:peptide/nickel transport system substrate-binding protein
MVRCLTVGYRKGGYAIMTADRRTAHDELLIAACTGQLSRRELIRRGIALGLTASALVPILAACGSVTPATAPATTAPAASVAPSSAPTTVASSAPTAAAGGAATARPATATTGAASSIAPAAAGKRGGGGTAKVLWWQGPAVLNPHLASGTKDFDASRVSYEPLCTFDGSEKLVPILAAEVPSKENGGLAADGKSVTYKLKQGVKWSDGQPFNADDVIFTYEYVTDQQTGAVTSGIYQNIASIDKVDDYTVKINFKEVTPGWYTVFSSTNGCIIPKHAFSDFKGTKAKDAPINLAPIGTGPYKVQNFQPGDAITWVINENYREANKPYFDTIQLKGGGDAPSAARAVLQTGDYDFAWNLQVEWSVLNQLKSSGGKGDLNITPGASCERVLVNFTDPNKDVDGERASIQAPHPFQTEPKVRQAYALLIDRDTIVKSLYGDTGVATANLLIAPAAVASKNTKYEFNSDKAAALLDEAGWAKGSDGIRTKNGVKLSVVFQTSVNSLRQKEQQLIKDAFDKAGIAMELKTVDQTVFFTSGPGQNDNYPHFYTDLEMYSTGPDLPDPGNYMRRFLTSERAQKANSWGGTNVTRYSNPQMDNLWKQAASELDMDKRNQLFIQMNDLAVSDVAEICVAARTGASAKTKTLKWSANSPWDSNLWDTANWSRA